MEEIERGRTIVLRDKDSYTSLGTIQDPRQSRNFNPIEEDQDEKEQVTSIRTDESL